MDAKGTDVVDVNWIRNPDGDWYLLDQLPVVLPSMQCEGIYIIWYFDESRVPQTVRVGIKGVDDHLKMMCKDPEIKKYSENALYITWTEVKPPPVSYLRRPGALYYESVKANKRASLDDLIGIWSYLCEKLKPLVESGCPQVDSIPVVLPWVPD